MEMDAPFRQSLYGIDCKALQRHLNGRLLNQLQTFEGLQPVPWTCDGAEGLSIWPGLIQRDMKVRCSIPIWCLVLDDGILAPPWLRLLKVDRGDGLHT